MVVPPLTQLWGIVNTLGQTVGRSTRVQFRPHSDAVTVTSVADGPMQAAEISQSIKETFEELGLHRLAEHLEVEELCLLLQQPTQAPDHLQSSLRTQVHSHMSSETFFENKNGFPQTGLHIPFQQTFSVSLPALHKRPHQRYLMPPMFLSQQRGFKTGHLQETQTEKTKPEKKSWFKLWRSKKSSSSSTTTKEDSEKLQSMLGKYDHSPEVQEKLKVAFAEGFIANHQEGKDQNKEPKPYMKKMTILVGILVVMMFVHRLMEPSVGRGGHGNNMPSLGMFADKYQPIDPKDITARFSDVKGADEAKEEFEDAVSFLKDRDKFTDMGAKLPKGILLVGPPGVGKTLLARAVAGEAGVPFFQASGSEFDELFVGMGASRIRKLFDSAKMHSPCVIFLDEIDSVGGARSSSEIHPYANQTINQLLSEMDGFEQTDGVIVIGATNRKESLDKALLRPGRFDIEIRVFPPDLKGRADILKMYLSLIKASHEIDIEHLARGTTGCTGADLENMVNQSAIKAALEGATEVTMAHIDWARDKVLMGVEKKSKIPDEEVNLMTAYHEAGHTLVAYYTKHATPLNKVTIRPRGMSLGHTSFVPKKEQYSISRGQLMAEIDVALGGRLAEEIIYGNDKVTTGASSDFQKATTIATAMVKNYGMSEKVGLRVFEGRSTSITKVNDISPAMAEVVDVEIKRLLQESGDRAKRILKTHKDELHNIAKALMTHETLDSQDIKAIVEGKKIVRQAIS